MHKLAAESGKNVLRHHINQLDGLRAIAILAVMFLHIGSSFLLVGTSTSRYHAVLMDVLAATGRGVDLFFVLSGFLITGILLDAREQPNYFQRFYWRRAVRIWPLYYAFLFAALVIHSKPFSVIGVAPFALYYRNFLGPDRASDVYFGHFWSLCVEEQFYLVWPFIIYFLPKRIRLFLVVFLFIVALCIRVYLLHARVDEYIIFRLPYCRMDDLLAGAAVAVLIRNNATISKLRIVSSAAVVLGLIGICYTGSAGNPLFEYRLLTVGLTSYAVLFGGVIGLCVGNNNCAADSLLGNKVFRAIATRSYAMYVFHLIPLYGTMVWLRHIHRYPHRKLSEIAVIIFIGLITYGLAWLSWRYFEEPFLRLKKWEWFAKAPMTTSRDTFPIG